MIKLIITIVFIFSFYSLNYSQVPTTPSRLRASTISATRVDLNIPDTYVGLTGYIWERKATAGAYSIIGTTNGSTSSFSDTTALAATSYLYRAKVTNVSGDSSYSPEMVIITPVAGKILTTIEIFPKTLRIDVGKVKSPVIVAKDQDGTVMKYIDAVFVSSNTSKLLSEQDIQTDYTIIRTDGFGRVGKVRGTAQGTANVTVTINGITSDVCAVTVKDPSAIPVASITSPDLISGIITTKVGEAIDVNFEGSEGFDRALVQWGDGETTSDLLSATYAYKTAGTKTVTLTVYNTSNVASSPVSISVVVNNHSAPTATFTVTTTSQLLTAWNSCTGGEVITIPAGTVMDNVNLPFRVLSNYVTIQTSATLPALNIRIDPVTDAAKLVTFQTVFTNDIPLSVAIRQKYVRFRGIKAFVPPSISSYNAIYVGFGTQTTVADNPEKIIFEHCVIKPSGTPNIVHGFWNDGYKISVLSCWFGNIGASGLESHGIAGLTGKGSHVYYNTVVQAAAINFMYGGSTTSIQNLTTSNVDFRYVYLYKDPAWRNTGLNVKNLFETKLGRRFYLYGCIFEYSWNEAQNVAIILKVNNEFNTNSPWIVSEDIVFESCRLSHVATAVGTLWDVYGDAVSQRVNNVRFKNFLMTDISNTNWGPFSGSFAAFSTSSDIRIIHVTAMMPDGTGIRFQSPVVGSVIDFVMQDSIVAANGFGILKDSGPFWGNAIIAGTGNEFSWHHNVFALLNPDTSTIGTPSDYPNSAPNNNNAYPTSIASIKFVDVGSENYRLADDSPYKNAASDGTNVGVNYTTLMTATAHTISGNLAGIPVCNWHTVQICN